MTEPEEYVVTCVSMEDLDSLYNDLETIGGNEAIPDRIVPVYRRRPLSQNTHYMLTEEEALALSQDLRVLDVKPVKLIDSSRKLCSYTQTGTFSKSPYTDAMDPSYRNWALLRCIEGAPRSGWGSDSTKDQTATITIGPTGKNVDFIGMDGICGVPNHPEFAVNADGSGGSRYVQYDWYQLNAIATSLDDDTATLLSGSYSYSGDSASDANHGAHITGTVAGNTCGWARDANIYQLGPLGQQGIGSTIIWDYVRAFHRNKPINPATGRRNPTICNCSYETTLTFPTPSLTLYSVVQANRRGTTSGPFGSSPYTPFTSSQLNAVGMYNTTTAGTVYTNVPWFLAAESADITQAINDGIIIVAAAGNSSFFMDKSTGPDYANWFIAAYGTATSFYLWNQHKGCAISSTAGVICVGAIDSTVTEKKAYYSNTGPGVDIYAPGTWIVSSLSTSTGGWGNGYTSPDSRNSSYYIGREIGTSMAAPQVTGILACLLEIYPNMTPATALSYITGYAKTAQLTDPGGTSPSWTSDTTSLQGSSNRYLYLPQERPTNGEMYPKQNSMNRPSSGILYPRTGIRLR
jgi:subtilisin family serine protease